MGCQTGSGEEDDPTKDMIFFFAELARFLALDVSFSLGVTGSSFSF